MSWTTTSTETNLPKASTTAKARTPGGHFSTKRTAEVVVKDINDSIEKLIDGLAHNTFPPSFKTAENFKAVMMARIKKAKSNEKFLQSMKD